MQSALGVGLRTRRPIKAAYDEVRGRRADDQQRLRVVQPFQARSHSRTPAISQVRVSHGVTRRETDGHPGSSDALKRLPLELGLVALGGVSD